MDSLHVEKPLRTYSNKRVLNTSSAQKSAKQVVFVSKRELLTTKKAVELLLSGTLRSKVCRFCLHITSPLSELDQIMQIATQGALYKVTIRDIVASFHPYMIDGDPNIPNKICEKCVDKALQSYRFAQKCEQSERALRNCLEDMSEKLDNLDPVERTKKRGRPKLHPNHNVLYTENHYVIDYAEPLYNLVNVGAESLTNETKMGEFECKKCWQVLPNLESLLNHEKIHPKTMWFHCRLCGKSFINKLNINRHLRGHAKEKTDIKNLKTDFLCKHCGHTSDNYHLHLQHIEKHKFKMVLEHLVERKMDQLCSVCLDRKRKLVGLDKMICLHGGYAELTGDRTLYNILGSAVPEPNYKYQELYIARNPKILRITKKIATNKLILSSPVIISVGSVKNAEKFTFEFKKPNNINDDGDYYLNQDNDNKICDQNVEVRDEELAGEENYDKNDDTIRKIVENQVLSALSSFKSDNDERTIKTKNLCKNCWIFKKPVCENCLYTSSDDAIAATQENEKNNTKNNIYDKCKFCWIFKNIVRCHICKKPSVIKSPVAVEKKTKVFDLQPEKGQVYEINNKGNTEVLNTGKKRKHFSLGHEDKFQAKKTKWLCKICLTENNVDRESCICCDSNCVYKDPIKLNYIHGCHDFLKAATKTNDQICTSEDIKEMKCESDFKRNDRDFDTKSTSIDQEIVTTNVPLMIRNLEDVVLTTPNVCMEDNKVKTSNNQEETMDVTEDATTIYPSGIPAQSYPSPFSSPFTSTPMFDNPEFTPSGPEFPKKLQFHIGSGNSRTFEDRLKRKSKRSHRRMMNIFRNYTGTKICEKCLDHAITSYVFINRTHYIRNRLNLCVAKMIENLENVNMDNKIYIEVSLNSIMAVDETYDENLLLDDDEIDESKLRVDYLEGEFKSKFEEEISSENFVDVKNEIENVNCSVIVMKEGNKLVNGFKNTVSNNLNEFLTFRKKANVAKNLKRKYRTCPKCNKHFITDYFLERHILKHLHKQVQCKKCLKTFNSKFYLREHKKATHVLKLSNTCSCQTCGRSFENWKKRELHEKCHIIAKHCELCSKLFATQKQFDSHLQRHAAKYKSLKINSAQTCSFCEKQCLNDNELSVHVHKVHLQIKPHSCDMCERQFYTERNLKNHKKIHNMPRKEKCVFCDKYLKCRRDLVIHIRKHIGITPYKCILCTKPFYSEFKMKFHMKKMHGGSFLCKLCRKVFVNKKRLKEHVHIAHNLF